MTIVTPTSTSSTATAANAVQTATKGLLTSLGSGSGIDTSALVTSLVEAQYAVQTARLTKKTETLTAQISGVATLKSTMTGFSAALDALAKGGTLVTQPKSSLATVAAATALPGAKLQSLSSSVAVTRLAGAQSVASAKVVTGTGEDAVPASRGTRLGSGTFTIELGTATYAADGKSITDFASTAKAVDGVVTDRVAFDLTDATVDTIAAAINSKAASLGISASVVTDTDGSTYLSLKGATGAAKAFSLAITGDDTANLKQFEVGKTGTTRVTGTAQNAELAVDGVEVQRATNSIDDLIAGVKLELTGTGTTSLTATKPNDSLTQAVTDVIDTYNQVLPILEEQTNAITGNLASDPAAKALLRGLKALTLQVVNPGAAPGEPRTLAELGVRTARDGTLSVDTKTLSAALAKYPDAVERMFQSTAASTGALPAKLKALTDSATSIITGLGASNTRYLQAQADIAKQQAKLADQSDAMTTRLTSQFAAMNSRVSAYKSVQSFLTNQIAAWNKSDS